MSLTELTVLNSGDSDGVLGALANNDMGPV